MTSINSSVELVSNSNGGLGENCAGSFIHFHFLTPASLLLDYSIQVK